MATAAGIPTVIASGLTPGVITAAAAGGEAGRHALRGARGALLELQAVAQVRQAGARPSRDRRRRRAGAARRGDEPATGRDRRDGGTSTPATRSRWRMTGSTVGKGISNYSADELRQVRGLKSRRSASCCRAPATRRSTGLLRAGVTSYLSSDGHHRPHRVTEICAAAKRASRELATLELRHKDAALEAVADALDGASATRSSRQMRATSRPAREDGLLDALIDRLKLDHRRIAGIAGRSARHRRAARSGRRGDRRRHGCPTGSMCGRCACRSA